MSRSLDKTFDAAAIEREVAAAWQADNSFHAEPTGNAPPYVILIPPPNVTAVLHVGHALNNTLQDILVRWRRMAGDNAVWLPGTDHAGIATQTVVEKKLLEQGKRRTDFTREAFIAHVQEWKDQYERRITDQLKAMGCSCDWQRQAFTMDAPRSRAVQEAFFRLFRDGLIYRGKRLVNWDPVTQTALADDEVEDEEVDGFFYYLRYPIEGAANEYVTVATTRPETMLGDTAVGVNPRDPRAVALRGKKVRLPIVGRVIPIVEDDYVVMPDPKSADAKARYATGFLKVTPAHDANDWELGQRHLLPVINIFGPDASISDKHGWEDVSAGAKPLIGLSREDARKAVVDWFKSHGLLEEIKPYRHAVGHSYRSGAAIEPYLSDQWYCRVTDDRMRGAALRAMAPDQMEAPPPESPLGDQNGDGKLRFFPSRYARTFQNWHENLRDWCISRQLWWGHRINVWSAAADSAALPAEVAAAETPGRMHQAIAIARQEGKVHVCLRDPMHDRAIVESLESAGFVQDPDVLDTWFSSALWPISTLGWPEQTAELARWNPSSTLCTAREIITLWVSRMVMFNRYLHGQLPFIDVLIHTMVQDGQGRKMSKSLGNGVDPLDIIASHGCDAMRFTLASMATHTQDVRLPVELDPETKRNTSPKFDEGRSFANKLWNVARFVCSSIEKIPAGDGSSIGAGDLSLVDRWLLSRLASTVKAATDALMAYRFDQYAKACYDFVERDFSDWYVEAAKLPLRGGGPAAKTAANLLATALDVALRLLHPVAPFVTERLWWALNEVRPTRGIQGKLISPGATAPRLICALFPSADAACADLIDAEVEQSFTRIQELVSVVRFQRNEHKATGRAAVSVRIKAPVEQAERISANRAVIEMLASCTITEIGPVLTAPDGAVRATIGATELYLEGLVAAGITDAGDTERKMRRREELAGQIKMLSARLANRGYAAKAPANLVQQTRDQLVAAEAELAKLG